MTQPDLRFGQIVNNLHDRTAEDIKINIGTAFKRAEVDYMDVRGRNLVTGLPETIRVSSDETQEALKQPAG